jgi:hypothetical protein
MTTKKKVRTQNGHGDSKNDSPGPVVAVGHDGKYQSTKQCMSVCVCSCPRPAFESMLAFMKCGVAGDVTWCRFGSLFCHFAVVGDKPYVIK